MDLLLFGGNSARNKDWINLVERKLSSEFTSANVCVYEHWKIGDEFINLEKELARLPSLTKNLGEYVIFAKSIGTILSMMAIQKGILNPKKCVYVGLPIRFVEQDKEIDLEKLILDNSAPSLFIQNTADPTAPFMELENFIKDIPNTMNYLKELPGDTHNYDDLESMKDLVKSFVFESK